MKLPHHECVCVRERERERERERDPWPSVHTNAPCTSGVANYEATIIIIIRERERERERETCVLLRDPHQAVPKGFPYQCLLSPPKESPKPSPHGLSLSQGVTKREFL